MRVVVFAYNLVGVRCLEALIKKGAEIVLVVTHQDDPKEEIWFPSVKALAGKNGIPVETPEDANVPAFVEKIRSVRPDVIFSFYYRKILKNGILQIPPKGAFNMHGSLLPKYRGRCPVNWVLIHGEKVTGVSLHEMILKPDAGDIVMQRQVPIEEQDTAHILFGKIATAAGQLMEEFYPLLESGQYTRTPQDHSQATVFGGRGPEDGRFSWEQDARQIYNLVRAVTHPYPGAFVRLGKQKLTVWRAQCSQLGQNGKEQPGSILSVSDTQGVQVATGRGALWLKRVQWVDEPEKDAAQFAREKKLKAGDKL